MYTKQISDMKYEVIFESEEELNKFNHFLGQRKTLKAKEVMEILGITRVTLCHYVKQGRLKVSQAFENAKYEYDAESVYKLKRK